MQQCSHFFLFEPICTAILLAACSIIHVIRIHAIYEKKRNVLFGMGGLLALQVVVTAICCGFYRCESLFREYDGLLTMTRFSDAAGCGPGMHC